MEPQLFNATYTGSTPTRAYLVPGGAKENIEPGQTVQVGEEVAKQLQVHSFFTVSKAGETTLPTIDLDQKKKGKKKKEMVQ